jgi:kynurenine formamidase
MISTIHHHHKLFRIDFSKPKDISICIKDGEENPNAFHAPNVKISPVIVDDFIGDIDQGGVVNFKNIKINPHGNGTHTECVGHISKETYTINQCLKEYMFVAKLITITPEKLENGDTVITQQLLNHIDNNENAQAIIIRTLPNEHDKETKNYSDTNPTYIHHEAMAYLVYRGYEHLLIDTPSVDRERDEAKFLAHKAFWKYPGSVRKNSTITELIYVDNEIEDGLYLLQFNVLNIELDASPSRPLLYDLMEV